MRGLGHGHWDPELAAMGGWLFLINGLMVLLFLSLLSFSTSAGACLPYTRAARRATFHGDPGLAAYFTVLSSAGSHIS